MLETVQWLNKIQIGHNHYLVFDYTYNYQHILSAKANSCSISKFSVVSATKLKPLYYTHLFIQSIHHQLNPKSVFMVKEDWCLE